MTIKSIPAAAAAGFLLLATAPLAEAHEVPSNGWSLHIDAKLHIAGDPDAIAHHFCKSGLAGGVIQCQLYDSDEPNARLIGVEVVIDRAAFESLGADERGLWHYHKEEIPKVSATLPGLSSEEAGKVAKGLEETYGKIFLIWDTTANKLPVGQPMAYADSTRVPK